MTATATGESVLVLRDSLPADLHRWRRTGTSADGTHAVLERPRSAWARLLGRRSERGPVRVVSLSDLDDVLAGAGDDEAARPSRVDQGPITGAGEGGRGGRARSWEPNTDELAGRRGVLSFDRMYAVDPVAEAGRLSMCQPVLAANWRAAPKPDGSAEIAEWVNARLGLGGTSGLLAGGWQLWLEATLTHGTRTGPAASEVVPWTAEDGGFAVDLLPIHPRTLHGFVVADDGSLVAVEQTGRGGVSGLGGGRIEIPGDLAQVWTHGRVSPSDWWGRPMGRGAWRGHRVKADAWLSRAIANERWGTGIPTASIDRETWDGLASESDRASLVDRITDALRQLRGGEASFVNPAMPGVKFSMFGVGSPGEHGGANIAATIERADFEILVAHMAPDLALGSSRVGARSLGEHFAGVRQAAIRALADSVIGSLVGPAVPGRGVVTRLVQWQFGVGPADVPRIVAEDLQDARFVRSAAELPGLVSAGLLQPDDETERAIRSAYDLPELSEQATPSQRRRIGRLRRENIPRAPLETPGA